jgi:hypothetical protein
VPRSDRVFERGWVVSIIATAGVQQPRKSEPILGALVFPGRSAGRWVLPKSAAEQLQTAKLTARPTRLFDLPRLQYPNRNLCLENAVPPGYVRLAAADLVLTIHNGPRVGAQKVAVPLTRAAIFLVATVNPGSSNRAVLRSFCADLSALVRAVEFRDLEGAFPASWVLGPTRGTGCLDRRCPRNCAYSAKFAWGPNSALIITVKETIKGKGTNCFSRG